MRPIQASARRRAPAAVGAGHPAGGDAHQVREILGRVGQLLAQRRRAHHVAADAIEQILPKPPRPRLPPQLAVRGGNQLAGEPARRGFPHPAEFAALQDAQQLDLNLVVELADLVEKDGAVLAAGLEPPAVVLVRPGEGALAIAEHLRLDQRRAQRRQVDRAGSPVAGSAAKVLVCASNGDVARLRDGLRRQLLAGPGLADDQRRDACAIVA